jgi:hypothetical protein
MPAVVSGMTPDMHHRASAGIELFEETGSEKSGASTESSGIRG